MNATERTDYQNLSPRTLVQIRNLPGQPIKVRRAVAAELRRRGLWSM